MVSATTDHFNMHGLDADAILQFQSLADFKSATFNSGEFIFQSGLICNEMFYITEGITRSFYIHEDKEINLRLVASNNVAIQYSSFITQEPSIEYIQCLTPCSGFKISLRDLKKIRAGNTKADYFLRVLAENHYLAMERRLFTLQHKSGFERYQYFLERMPAEIVEQTPAQHIASYLGLTPESFSRIKRELNK
ncbi:MAG: Crp/Fnr family transcriptional regulator [Pseudomonadales bacterium]|nr:Crp/Fnr family transcriptional regulator [Pseudomonadales bacterium]